MTFLEEYYNQIVTGKVVTSKRVKAIYERLVHEMNNSTGRWKYDVERGNRPVEFIERFLKQSKGEWIGQPLKLELFQKAYINALFGFVDKDTGLRRFKESLFVVGRKNGKSTLLAGIGLYMMVADGEGGAEVYSVATKKDQARIVFTEAVNMVRQSPELSRYIKKRKTDMYMPLTFSKFEPLASEADTLDGLNAHCVIMDELHAIKDRQLYEVMKQSMSARRQPLLVMITTAGTVRECIFDDMYDYATKIVDGLVEDERFLPIIYELDNRDEWTDWRCWQKANPGLGTIKKFEDLAEKVERAKENPKELPGLLTKEFNIRENVAESWLPFSTIENTTTFNIKDLRGCYAIGGVDLSSTTDLTCATLLVVKNGIKYVIQQYFMPADTIEQRANEDKVPYNVWRDRGLITPSGGRAINYSDVTKWFVKMVQQEDIHPLWVGYDPWNSGYWLQEMKDYGFEMVEVRQGYKTLSQPMKQLGADLAEKKVIYNNNPILKWCLSNLEAEEDINGNIRPVKGKNRRARIDGAVSLIIAYAVLQEKWNDYIVLQG